MIIDPVSALLRDLLFSDAPVHVLSTGCNEKNKKQKKKSKHSNDHQPDVAICRREEIALISLRITYWKRQWSVCDVNVQTLLTYLAFIVHAFSPRYPVTIRRLYNCYWMIQTDSFGKRSRSHLNDTTHSRTWKQSKKGFSCYSLFEQTMIFS